MTDSAEVRSASGLAATSGRRIFGLDLLRAVAILMIVYIHGGYLLETIVPFNIYIWPTVDGVSLFFVLSGYLIGRIIVRSFVERPGSYRSLVHFWGRRWFRTLPNYFLILAIIIIYTWSSGSYIPEYLPLYFIFSQNLFHSHPNFFPEAWSLSIEEWFYLLAPIVTLLFLAGAEEEKQRLRRFLVVILAIIVLSPLVRTTVISGGQVVDYESWSALVRTRVLTRLDAIAMGVLGAIASLYAPALWRRFRWPLAVCGLLLIVVDRHLLATNLYYATFLTLNVLPAGTLLMLPLLSTLEARAGLFPSTIEWISRLSYSMYLVNLTLVQHLILPQLLRGPADGGSPMSNYFLYWVFTIGISYFLYRFWELPMMNLRDRFPETAAA